MNSHELPTRRSANSQLVRVLLVVLVIACAYTFVSVNETNNRHLEELLAESESESESKSESESVLLEGGGRTGESRGASDRTRNSRVRSNVRDSGAQRTKGSESERETQRDNERETEIESDDTLLAGLGDLSTFNIHELEGLRSCVRNERDEARTQTHKIANLNECPTYLDIADTRLCDCEREGCVGNSEGEESVKSEREGERGVWRRCGRRGVREGEQLVFVHLMKTAGTLFQDVLDREVFCAATHPKAGGPPVLVEPRVSCPLYDGKMLNTKIHKPLEECSVMMGHNSLIQVAGVLAGCKTDKERRVLMEQGDRVKKLLTNANLISIVRDPFERFVSQWHYTERSKGRRGHFVVTHPDVTFLESWESGVAHHYSIQNLWRQMFGKSQKLTFELVKDELPFTLLGAMERFDEFLLLAGYRGILSLITYAAIHFDRKETVLDGMRRDILSNTTLRERFQKQFQFDEKIVSWVKSNYTNELISNTVSRQANGYGCGCWAENLRRFKRMKEFLRAECESRDLAHNDGHNCYAKALRKGVGYSDKQTFWCDEALNHFAAETLDDFMGK